MAINDYSITDTIYKSKSTIIYRAIRLLDKKPVVIKALSLDGDNPSRLFHDYEIGIAAKDDGIIEYYSIEAWQERLTLVMEDIDGYPLQHHIKANSLSISDRLWIATSLSKTLVNLHQLHIIHKDIKPNNVIVNIETRQLRLIDFGISTSLTRECQTISSPSTLEGSLSYMSPEQTGRMNRDLDYRSDFYSLGMTLYELFVGTLPFIANDEMEWVHCHLARQPMNPHTANPDVPAMLADIIMRLIEKCAEDRYQSAFGIWSDLEKCKNDWLAYHRIDKFQIGTNDVTERFEIPQKIYGRDEQIAELLHAFERMCSGKRELMLVSGPSGIGKSSLIREVHKPITAQRGYFISGKFDQFKKNIPYSALVEAFSNLLKQILTENPTQIANWKIAIQDRIGDNINVLSEVLTEIEMVVGPQPPAVKLLPAETQNRFIFLLTNFIRIFATQDHPLVLFLDDMQWADSGTLKVLESLLGDQQVNFLFVIAAYRNTEVDLTHPFALTLAKIAKTETRITQLELNALSSIDLNRWLADSVKCPIQDALSFSEVLIQKTQGNPFFFSRLLQSLYNDNLIYFNRNTRQWAWKLGAIKKLQMPEDVAIWMASKLKELPPEQLNIVKHAACIGNTFSLATLSMFMGIEPSVLLTHLGTIVDSGLIIPMTESYIAIRQSNDGWRKLVRDIKIAAEEDRTKKLIFKFMHDKVEYAAYSLIEESSRQPLHLKIGKLMLAQLNTEEVDERVFEILSHLNQAATLIFDREEHLSLAKLNYKAASKAKDSAAFEVALRYLKQGMALLPKNAWDQEYHLTLYMHLARAESAILTSDFAQMAEFVALIKLNAKSLHDKLLAYEIEIRACSAQSKLLEGLALTREVMHLLGDDYPARIGRHMVILEFAKTVIALHTKSFQTLVNGPDCIDNDQIIKHKFLAYCGGITYIADQNLYLCLLLRALRELVQKGNTPEAGLMFITYGSVISNAFGAFGKGNFFIRVGMRMIDRFKDHRTSKEIATIINCFVHPWRMAFRDILPLLLDGYNDALSVGSIEFAGYQSSGYCWTLFYAGENLQTVLDTIAHHHPLLRKNGMERQFVVNLTHEQVVLKLMGRLDNPPMLSDDGQALAEMEAEKDANHLGSFFCYKALLSFIFCDYESAYRYSKEALKYQESIFGLSLWPSFCMFYALTLIKIIPDLNTLSRVHYLIKVKLILKKFELWAKYASVNHLHRQHLIQAELARLDGDIKLAIDLYIKAINTAKENKFYQDFAVANDLFFRFFMSIDCDELANIYFAKTINAYKEWGADGKVHALNNEFPEWATLTTQLLNHENDVEMPSIATLPNGSSSSSFTTLTKTLKPTTFNTASITSSTNNIKKSKNTLDIVSVLKSAQAISGKIHLPILLEEILKIVMENAGAHKGTMLLLRKEVLFVEIEINQNDQQASNVITISVPMEQYIGLPHSIINYSYRSKKSVVIENAAEDNHFSHDNYIAKSRCKSILCNPIQLHGCLIGLVYLENNLASGAFTEERIRIIDILSAQAAISIENATLYENLRAAGESLTIQNLQLEEMVDERTKDLRQALIDLKKNEQELLGTQQQLILSEKMVSLGILVSSVAHEINTPIASIKASSNNIVLILHDIVSNLKNKYSNLSEPIIKRFIELISARIQNIDVILSSREERIGAENIEKKLLFHGIEASLEVCEMLAQLKIEDNIERYMPLFKHENSDLILKQLLSICDAISNSANIKTSVEMVSKIVFALKSFSYKGDNDDYTYFDAIESIETVLTIYQNKTKNNVSIVRHFEGEPKIFGVRNELQQVWINLIHNALHAMNFSGTLTISVATIDDAVTVDIEDTGAGIDKSIRAKIFDPFFTTKAIGEGSGLGLNIAKKIVEKHLGTIDFTSVVGKTVFTVSIPNKSDVIEASEVN